MKLSLFIRTQCVRLIVWILAQAKKDPNISYAEYLEIQKIHDQVQSDYKLSKGI